MHARYILTSLLIVLCILAGACTAAPAQVATPISQEMPPTSTPAATAVLATTAPALPPTKTPRTAINLDGYALTYKGITCPLKAVEFYDRYVFQADCADPIYILQGTTITLTFETPNGQPLPISPVEDMDALFGALEPPFLFCEFGSVDGANTITFISPFQQLTGRDILCAFSVPLQGEDLVMALTGLTTR